jgi:hypothetical protein
MDLLKGVRKWTSSASAASAAPDFGQEFIPFLKTRGMPMQKCVFEWCCGPSFTGFSMLGNGLCQTFCLADINPAAVASCQNTVRTNNLAERILV